MAHVRYVHPQQQMAVIELLQGNGIIEVARVLTVYGKYYLLPKIFPPGQMLLAHLHRALLGLIHDLLRELMRDAVFMYYYLNFDAFLLRLAQHLHYLPLRHPALPGKFCYLRQNYISLPRPSPVLMRYIDLVPDFPLGRDNPGDFSNGLVVADHFLISPFDYSDYTPLQPAAPFMSDHFYFDPVSMHGVGHILCADVHVLRNPIISFHETVSLRLAVQLPGDSP